MKKILFLCTGNCRRSPMAEGIARHLAGDRFEVFSAGIEANGIDARAVKAMETVGIDISNQTSDPIDQQQLSSMDYVVTLCDDAKQRCPRLTPECHCTALAAARPRSSRREEPRGSDEGVPGSQG